MEISRQRSGIGYDAHALALGRKLVLGGIDIPFEKGLDGWSDADVLTHAIIDALLGAAGMSYTGKTKQMIEYAAILHDIGKLSIPDSILNKAENPNDEEWEIIRQHPVVGHELLKEIPMLQEASKLILYHHERYDGSGYPQGLGGEDIPMGARLIAVADAFDNMTTEHSYRKALSGNKAFAELNRCSGSQFCPVAIKAFKAGFLKSRVSQR